MLELAQLKFAVDTSELKTAVDLVKTLGDATRELGQDVSKLAAADKNAAAASLMNAKARKENAQAAAQEAKNAKAVVTETNRKVKAEKEVVEATSQRVQVENKAAEASIRSAKATKSNTDMLQRQQDILEFMTQGYTRGQARQLAMYKSTGALTDQLKEMGNVLQSQNKLIGGDPFDKSSSHIRKMQQEVTELTHGLKYLNQGMIGSSEQLRGFTRDSIRLVEAAKSQGRSIFSIRDALREQRQEYQSTIGVHSQLVAREKEQERLSKEIAKALVNQAKANDYVVNELKRAENALQGLNGQLQISSSNRILKFEQALNKSGLSVEQRTAQLEKYKAVIIATDAARAKAARRASMEQSERQVNLLARSLAPQISDVLVSLQTGMNPFTVMMQQGMQVRDLIQLSGVESEKLGEAFKRAGQGMIATSFAAGKAIGSMILGVITDAGKMVSDFGLKVTGLGSHFNTLRNNFIGMAMSGDKFISFLGQAALSMGRLATFAAGLAVALPIASLIGFAVGLRQVIKEENELAKALALNAANLGISQNAAIQYAKSFDSVSASTGQVIGVLTEMAKVGQFSRNEFDLVVTSALNMQKYADVAIEDTVKAFAKLKEDPVQSILELAKTTGMIAPAVQTAVMELQRQGDTAGAVALAMKTLADVNNQQVSRMKEDYNGFTMFIMSLGSAIKKFFSDTFKELFYKADPAEALKKQLAAVNDVLNGTIVGKLGIGKDYYTNLRDSLSKQILLMDKARQAEEDRIRDNAKIAEINAKANAAYIASLSEEEKHKIKLRDIDKDIAEARLQNNEKAVEAFEKLRKKEIEDHEERLKKKNRQKRDPVESSYEKALYSFSKAAIEAENRTEDLTRSELKLLQLRESPEWAKYNKTQRDSIILQAQAAIAYEKTAKAIKQAQEASKQSAKEAFDNEARLFDEMVKTDEALKNSAKAINEETQMLEYQASIIGLTSEERAKAIEFRKLEIELAEELRKIEENPYTKLDPSWAAEQRAKAHENFLKKRANLDAKYDLEYNQKLTDDLTDAVMTGLIEGGKAGKKKLRDLIVAELQKPIQVFIQATISNIFGGGNGGLTGGSGGWLGAAIDYITGGSGSGSGGFGQGILSTISSFFTQGSGKGIGGMVQNAVTNAFAHYGTASTYGTAFGSQQTAMLAAQEAGMGTAAGGSGMGAAAGWAAFAYAMYKIADNSYKKDWTENSAGLSKDGERGGSSYSFGRTTFQHDLSQSEFKGLGKAIAALPALTYKDADKFGIASSKWNYILSGMQVMSMLFGRKLKGYGYNVDIQGSDVDVGGYQYYKGGLFRSNKTVEFDVNPKDAEDVRLQVEAIRAGTKAMSLALGGGTEAIDNFTGNLKIDFKGAETAAEQAERMSEAWDQLQAEMLTAGTGIEYTKEKIKQMREEAMALASASGYNEQGITDALVGGMTGRMSEADVGAALGDIIVGSVYNALAMGFANQITGMITSMIIQPIMTTVIAGGSVTAAVSSASINAVVSQAQAAINAFNQVIADPAFQGMIGQLNSMVGSLASISVKPARNIKSFGSAVRSAGNAAKEAADKIKRETYDLQTELLQALGMTDKLRQRELANINSTNHALKKQIWALEDARSLYEKMQDAAKDSLDKAKEAQDKLKQIFDYLLENILELRGEVTSTQRMQVQDANTALLSMIASGSVDDYEKLQEIVDVLRDDIAGTTYSSKVEQDRANLKLSNLLETLKVSVGTELEQVDQEIVLLEQAIEKAEEQINTLLGIQANTFSTTEAIQALNEAVGAYSAQIAAAIKMSSSFSTGAAPSSSSSSSKSSGKSSGGGGGSSSTVDPSRAANINKLYQMVLGRAGDQKGIEAYAATKLSMSQIAADLASSKEFDSRYGSRVDEITALYKGLLGRNPDAAGLANYLNSNLSIGQIAKALAESVEFKNLRGFASGGYYPGGSAIVGEHGPELIDFTRPGRVYTASETQSLLGNSDNARIDARLANLENAMTQMVIATNKMQKVLNNARGEDGSSLNVIITNSQPVKVTS